ncbi:dimethylaniline monooxygenase 2 [Colletotrichum musicola]|uniref:Dimethylaniline monooxygenase 2 n=1 Tax=Colletotrichum musicola TaxID=2175873 RepID=A0A8H6JTJ8_9PEZI|nr:dimethylaniline monooxygenase 2 [Colletotrichum musicola]
MAGNASTKSAGNHVGIIGAGMIGLVTLKNLKEQGLEGTIIDQNDYIGGTWHYSGQPGQTSALPMTTFNTSKQCTHYTDFPFPEEAKLFPTAEDVEKYIEAYAEKFDLKRHVQFSKKVTRIEREEASGKWAVYTRSTKAEGVDAKEQRQVFDKIVTATGILTVPVKVDIKGAEKFEGEVVHSRDFKDPYQYADKNVLVVGIGASGADTQSFLKRAKARSVTVSHRGQYYLLPKMVQGRPFDHSMSLRGMTMIRSIGNWWPRGCAWIMSQAMLSARKKAFPWLAKHPSFTAPRVLNSVAHRIPFFSDDLADNLKDGSTKAVAGVREISGPKSVTLTDGTVLEDIDAIIVCSGYHHDFSLIKGPGNPIDPAKAPDGYERINAARFKDPHDNFPRLYRGFISEQYPESLACLGHLLIMGPPFAIYDITSMALAAMWAGEVPTPTKEEMARDIDTHYDVVVDTLSRGPMPHMGARIFGSATFEWINKAAGTGVTERLGCFSYEAWKLWWQDRKFYNLLMDGVNSPALYRLFDTGRGRKPWPGAREQIEKMNESVKELDAKWERENNKKTK